MTTIDRLRHPSISEAVTRAAGIDPEPIPSRGVTRWTAQARQDRPRPFGRTSGPRRLSGPFLADGGTVGDGSRVHPRVCGEARTPPARPLGSWGPSPRVRGSRPGQRAYSD